MPFSAFVQATKILEAMLENEQDIDEHLASSEELLSRTRYFRDVFDALREVTESRRSGSDMSYALATARSAVEEAGNFIEPEDRD